MASRTGGKSPDRTWTHAERDSTRYRTRVIPPVAQLRDPKPSELRRTIAECWCWWCDRGEWKVLALHTSLAHGIDAEHLRELAEIPRSRSILSPEQRVIQSTRQTK